MTETPESDRSIDETEPVVEDSADAAETAPARRRSRRQIVAYGVLPALAVLLAVAAGYLLWRDVVAGRDDTARSDSVQAARDITVSMLTYQPDTIDQQLAAARERLSGPWKEQYGMTVETVIAPEAKAQRITASAAVAASASVSAEPERAVVLLFVNQTVAVGNAAPTVTPSSVRVTLEKIDDRWLISGFEPV